MSSCELFPLSRTHSDLPSVRSIAVAGAGRAVVVGIAIALAGCSADITRFDFPAFNGSEGASAPSVPPRPIGNVGAGSLANTPVEAQSGNSMYVPPRAPRPEARMSPLPEPQGSAAPLPPAQSMNEPPRRQQAALPQQAPAPAPLPSNIAKGEQIEVQQGDTLYALSKRHKVSISELMTVNDLKNPNLKPGQKLHLPAGKHAAAAPQRPAQRPEPSVAAAPAPAAPSNWNGSYTIKAGDSLYGVARQHRVGLAELQSANGISDPRKVRPGTVIKVPGSGAGGPAVAAAPAAPAPVSQPVTQSAEVPRVVSAQQQPTILNAPEKGERVAAAGAPGVASDAAPSVPAQPQAKAPTSAPAATPVSATSGPVGALPGGKLRWPVKGKVIAGFGPRGDGTHNDGINVAVPLGSDVHAAEAGVVAYAGSELKGYGNLILIRHDNGWVTAYAHNDQILVKRGDKIKRGQVVAKAGKTGTVDQPQVHFELRQGSKPVDPTPYMEKL